LNPKPKLIYNPAAGKGSAGRNLPHVQALLTERGFEYDLLLTQAPGHALEAARQAAEAGCPLVIAAGGDGTANEILNGLMQAEMNGKERPTLAVLPIGRGNDFAYGVNIPTQLQPAVEVLVEGHQRMIDVGRVTGGDYPQGRYFGNGVGLGFDTVVGFEAAKIKWLRGAASYLAALVKTIFLYSKAPVYEICLDGGAPVRKAFLMVSVMNGTRMGGTFHMAPDGDPGDGFFDLCQVGQVPQAKIIFVAAKFINGTQKEHPAVQMLRARQVTIHAIQGTIPAHADGETICTAGSDLRIELFPAALAVVTQKHAG
jgi:YegS/Rv2252/BmrU family lipid kinase